MRLAHLPLPDQQQLGRVQRTLLASDLLEALLGVCRGELDKVSLDWDPRPAVCVVMASGGYPDLYEKGKVISGLEDANAMENVTVFHAGTAKIGDDIVTNGGRVLGKAIPK